MEMREIGKTGLKVTPLGIGGAPLGGLYNDVSQAQAFRTIRRALELGINFMDTAPLYGHGKSEGYFGDALAGVPRNSYVLSTKVGRLLRPSSRPNAGLFKNAPMFDVYFDYSRDGILRSVEDSLRRLRLDRIDIALIHDPDNHWEQAIKEAYPALADLRSRGVVKAIGVGMNQWQMLARFAKEGDFDCFLLAGRYTLLDQSALAELMPLCRERNVSVIIGGPYNSGILASNLSTTVRYNYEAAPPEVVAQARRIKAVCERHQVPMKAAALQFCLAHPAVAAVIPGPRSVAELEDNVNMANFPIPGTLWRELIEAGLIPKHAPVPGETV
ncbi:MAG: aldo/keto reductase [SAR202 cluster bacterium]|nr:aldo/keto reductase [SAR202 cluster bacterium]